MSDLDAFSHAQKERLAFIDFSLQYFGEIARADLVLRFKTGLAACTRDFAAYKELAPNNLVLVHQTKSYHRTEQFQPVFVHNPEAILTGLCRGFGNGLSSEIEPSEVCIDAVRLIHPDSTIIAALMRAINRKKAIVCDYVSLSSGPGRRELVPHSIANNGHRWHVRVYDRKSKQFRDFVCTRLSNIEVIEGQVATVEQRAFDKQWNKILTLDIVPHPRMNYPQAIEMDYAMTDGRLTLEVRAALAGYLLRQWNVDCSQSRDDSNEGYQLALADLTPLAGVKNPALIPGYSATRG